MSARSARIWPLVVLGFMLPLGTLTVLARGVWLDHRWRLWSLCAWVAVCAVVYAVSFWRVMVGRRTLAIAVLTGGLAVHLGLAVALAAIEWSRAREMELWSRIHYWRLPERYGEPSVEEVVPPACWTHRSSPPYGQLMAAPTRIEVGGKTLVLHAGAGRNSEIDFGWSRGDKLGVKAILATVDATPLPRGVDLDRLWVVKSATECWETPHTAKTRGEYRGLSPEHMARELVATLGPKWEPGSEIDIVARILVPGQQPVLLRTAKWRIER